MDTPARNGPGMTCGEVKNARVGQVILLGALAGGMGWGIRGQYGHETGAMIAGLLVGLVLVLLLGTALHPLQAMRAAALCAAGIGFGGAITYGQTIGLTQNPELVGNWAALGWGMLGLGIKGAVWIGFAGVFLGMGLSGIRYHPREMAMMLGGLLALTLLGMWALNMPFDPTTRTLPRIYFSADWCWYPNAGAELKPRRELWGGLAFALAGLVCYAGWFRKDRLARNLGLWGCAGGLGFPIGQSLQAWHAWHGNLPGFMASYDKMINWWNFMETIFGLVLGGALGLGLWFNRHRIAPAKEPPEVSLKLAVEFGLLGLHVPLLLLWEFAAIGPLDAVGDLGIARSLIPIIAIAGGRLWPWLMALPVVAMPILGKTAASLGFASNGSAAGAMVFVALPFVALTWVAVRLSRGCLPQSCPRGYLSRVLLINTWLYLGLNFAVFKFPWPWQAWTARTPNALVFAVCAVGLSWAAWRWRGNQERMSSRPIRPEDTSLH